MYTLFKGKKSHFQKPCRHTTWIHLKKRPLWPLMTKKPGRSGPQTQQMPLGPILLQASEENGFTRRQLDRGKHAVLQPNEVV